VNPAYHSSSDPDNAKVRTTPEEWNELRVSFNRSLLVDTSLVSLAENIDGCIWPLTGSDETAAAYIDFTFTEVIAQLAARGQPASRLDNLVDILRGTVAFDESFGDMAGIASKAEAETDPVKRNLERLDINPNFPVKLCNFTPGMHDFCAREGMETLTDFLGFTRSVSRQVFISGEFQELFNSVSHIDEAVIARYLPFRIHSTGLHMVEALAFLVRPLSPAERAQVAKRAESLPAATLSRAREYAAYFRDEVMQMRVANMSGTTVNRLAAPLDDLELEPATAGILTLLIRESAQNEDAEAAAAKAKVKAAAEAAAAAKLKAEADAAAAASAKVKAEADAAAAATAKAKAKAEADAMSASARAEATAASIKAKAEADAATVKEWETHAAAAKANTGDSGVQQTASASKAGSATPLPPGAGKGVADKKPASSAPGEFLKAIRRFFKF